MIDSKLSKPKIAIIHPRIWRGGSEACALWAIEALKKNFHVTLLTSSVIDLNQLNHYYKTNLQEGEFNIIIVPIPIPLRWIKGLFYIRYYRLARYCKKKSFNYHVMFSSYNPMDFGRIGIQYILDPTFNEELLNKIAGSPSGIRGVFYSISLWRKTYGFISRKLSGSTIEGIRRNVTLVDSDWTGELTRKHLKIRTRTIYPPVVTKFSCVSWEKREHGFVCVGRINPEKKIEKVIQIIHELNKKGFSLHLHIIGAVGSKKYLGHLKEIASDKKWIYFDHDIPFVKKEELLSSHRYGIHGRNNEPFGISIVEMIKAGCVVWVPNGGGQIEIVKETELTYNNCKDAVIKISDVLESADKQRRLRYHLEMRSRLFSTEIYMKEIEKSIECFLSRSDTSIEIS